MAHNRDDDFEKYYKRKTIGQLLLLHDNILDWIVLTNPWGSGDEEAGEQRGTPIPKRYRDVDPTPQVAERYGREIARSYGKNSVRMVDKGKVDRADLPLKVRALLNDLEKGRDASRRR